MVFLISWFAVIVLLVIASGVWRYGKGVLSWIDQRLPLGSFFHEHLAKYPAPKNLNWLYAFGALAIVAVAMQYITGIWLLMYYVPIVVI